MSGEDGGERPRVLHLITRLLHGGAEAKTLSTVRGLDGYDFTVGYGAEYDPDQVAALADDGIATRRFRLLRHYDPVTAVPAVLAIARYIRQEEFDLVHTHSTEAGIVGRFAASLADVPAVVHTVHGVPFTEDRNGLLNRFALACERAVAPRTDRIVANADGITDQYLDLGIGERRQYRTVYSGIDLERFRSAEPVDLPGDGLRVTMVGRLVEGKGLGVLLDAVERLEAEDLTVCVVGEGPERERFEADVRERGLEGTVRTLGYRDDVERVLAASDVFVLPSFREGTPRVVTEAMASGLPVVATDIAGVPEQVEDGENGYLVAPGDPEALADRLDALLDDGELRESFGAAGQKRAERFSSERMLADLDEVYRELLAG
jgi:glycosyltransferase involved in cell wall biosynthesis